jgi:hypothetical protein
VCLCGERRKGERKWGNEEGKRERKELTRSRTNWAMRSPSFTIFYDLCFSIDILYFRGFWGLLVDLIWKYGMDG